MTNIKKLSYFIILFAMSNMVQGGNYNKASLELNGIEDGKTYSSPIKIDFIVKNMKVVKAGVNEKNSGHHHLLLNLDEMPNLKMPLPMTENILHYGKGQTSRLKLPSFSQLRNKRDNDGDSNDENESNVNDCDDTIYFVPINLQNDTLNISKGSTFSAKITTKKYV